MSLFGYSADMCPRCGCNNAPLVWLGNGKGWLCEDCFDKEKRDEKRDKTKKGEK